MPRYVILRHELPPGGGRMSHYDLMFDTGDVLRTWAVTVEPDSPTEQTAEQLADHRRQYLTLEGPLSGHRGSVTRWDEGTYETLQDDEEAFIVDVQGKELNGRVQITRGRYAYDQSRARK